VKEAGLLGLSPETIGKMSSVFRKYPAIEKVLVYGSRAKGTFKAGSDIDLAVISSQFNVGDLLKLEGELDDLLLPYKVDISLLHTIESQELLDHIQRVGKTFYQR
jgi:predicted nucleotidyltransferase